MEAFYAACEVVGIALAVLIAVPALSAVVLDRPLGLLAGAAGRMEGQGHSARPLGAIALVLAAMVVAASILFPPLGLLAAAAALWLFVSRRRRAARKHAGLRTLR
jgi:hypothetical protein